MNWTSIAISILIDVVRNQQEKEKWRRALLKVFREIARAFSKDKEFLAAAKQEMKA